MSNIEFNTEPKPERKSKAEKAKKKESLILALLHRLGEFAVEMAGSTNDNLISDAGGSSATEVVPD